MLGFERYPTFQVFLAVFIGAAIAMILMPLWIRLLRYREIGQQVRADGPERHLVKQGTPTMAGVIILFAVFVTCLLLASFSIQLVLVSIATIIMGLLGFIDDASKVAYERSLGLSPSAKLIGQGLISVTFCLLAVNLADIEPIIVFPFVDFALDLGVLTTTLPIGGGFDVPWLYIVFVFLLMAGFSNSVNLTDGLDGLAGGTVMIVMLVMAMIAYRHDEINLAIFSAAIAGACIGFLWFNSFPADIFMGDTGSLALGTALAGVAVLTKTEVVSLVIGAIFIFEAFSVILQVVSFKSTGKRIFLMAPIHHHFERKGWSETQVVIRFWIIAAAFAAIGFALYFAGSL